MKSKIEKYLKYVAAAIFIATLAINVVVTSNDPFVLLSDEAIATTTSTTSSSSSDDNSPESGWSRFWNNIGDWMSNAWSSVIDFFEWSDEFATEVTNRYNSYTTFDTNWGQIHIDPYGNPFKNKGGVTITLTPNW